MNVFAILVAYLNLDADGDVAMNLSCICRSNINHGKDLSHHQPAAGHLTCSYKLIEAVRVRPNRPAITLCRTDRYVVPRDLGLTQLSPIF